MLSDTKEIFIEGDKIVYRCFADMSIKGYFSRDEIQQHLYRLIIKESN